MALFAGGAKLPLVDVCMAISTFLANVGKHRFSVAPGTAHALVHAAQREAGLVVIELRDIANGFPSALGMAVLAGDIQRSVRATAADVARSLRRW